jgi:hypothetical protein
MYNRFTVNEFNLQEFTVQPQTEWSDLVWQLNLQFTPGCSTSLSHSKEACVIKTCTAELVIGNMIVLLVVRVSKWTKS